MKVATIEDIKLEVKFRAVPHFDDVAYAIHYDWWWNRQNDELYWRTKDKDYVNIKKLSNEHLGNILNLYYYKEFKKCLTNTKIQDFQKDVELIKYLNNI